MTDNDIYSVPEAEFYDNIPSCHGMVDSVALRSPE